MQRLGRRKVWVEFMIIIIYFLSVDLYRITKSVWIWK